MEKYPHLDALATVASNHPQWNWYAIADSAQEKDLPGALTAVGGEVRCLLGATQGSPLAENSPHLVSLPSPARGGSAWEWIARMGVRKPCVTVVASKLEFGSLFEQLKQLTEIRLPDDTEMFFAFWDPAILGTLIGQPDDSTLYVKGPVFDNEQLALLYGGLSGWWYWDRDGEMHTIAIEVETPTIHMSKPLKLRQPQVDELVDASTPDHVLYYVDLNQPHLLRDIRPQARYGYVARALLGARDIGLETMKDLVNYVSMTLIYGKRWNEDSVIAGVLARVKNGEIRFSEAMESLP
ncbi:protein of unknown function [Duganella sp. CF517]|uniref:DUF4123 domain-containing protein n=1 Tax=Duganella sp. CF517 TaxID=1881038 RepID=UPI0008D87C3B|nr:DUF4123 domain-containing protein [Duganella sp. CF517]SEO63600.1 protein of unknown function [Duganella sp. CF517]